LACERHGCKGTRVSAPDLIGVVVSTPVGRPHRQAGARPRRRAISFQADCLDPVTRGPTGTLRIGARAATNVRGYAETSPAEGETLSYAVGLAAGPDQQLAGVGTRAAGVNRLCWRHEIANRVYRVSTLRIQDDYPPTPHARGLWRQHQNGSHY